jgi:hypothetical protein
VYERGGGLGDAGGLSGAPARWWPQRRQNLVPARCGRPQCGHGISNAAPHSSQNAASGGLSWPHDSHRIGLSQLDGIDPEDNDVLFGTA